MYLAAAAVIKRGRRVCGRIFDHFYRILDSISSILNYDFETGTLGNGYWLSNFTHSNANLTLGEFS